MTKPNDADVKYSNNGAVETLLKKQRVDRNDWCYASTEDVQDSFCRCELSRHARFVKGDVQQTLLDPRSLSNRISIVRLDTDWYESTHAELEVLERRLTNIFKRLPGLFSRTRMRPAESASGFIEIWFGTSTHQSTNSCKGSGCAPSTVTEVALSTCASHAA